MLNFSRFVLTRAIMAMITLIIVSLVVFSLMELVPGDCAERYLAFKNTQGSGISVEDIEIERQRLGLDKPFLARWGIWIVNAFQGEFGDSCILRVNIAQLLGDKFMLLADHLSCLSGAGLCHRHSGGHHFGRDQQSLAQQRAAPL
ncbi:hypothetical protein ACM25N_16515 [Roseovarius sp. C7]|uniref:hypothetical protein n=1 Tax=Roseovarius sp. C7 TaxID=3398643 RepID=UPI0039F693FA